MPKRLESNKTNQLGLTSDKSDKSIADKTRKDDKLNQLNTKNCTVLIKRYIRKMENCLLNISFLLAPEIITARVMTALSKMVVVAVMRQSMFTR